MNDSLHISCRNLSVIIVFIFVLMCYEITCIIYLFQFSLSKLKIERCKQGSK